MRLDAIRTFLAVVEAGSYAAAAESQYHSATTLHGHVKSIQEELGATLFTFAGRRLELTAAGHEFLLFAERTVTEYDAMQRTIGSRVRTRVRPLRVMSSYGPSVHLLPPVIREWTAAHEDAAVTVEMGQKGESLAALSAGQIDVAVMNDAGVTRVDDALERTRIYSDRLVGVVRSDRYRAPDLELLASMPVAAQPGGHPTREYLERWARRQGLELNVLYEHGAFDGVFSHVRAGAAVGFVSEYVVQRSGVADEFTILELPELVLQRSITALHRADADERTRGLVRLLVEHCASMDGATEAELAIAGD
jgi:DNA-binding transcriptional LysR family regulator